MIDDIGNADQAGERGYTRLQTNLTYDQRDSLQRLIGGDFFTPVRELSGAVPMGGVSFSKHYPMDPFFIQYPTLSLNTTRRCRRRWRSGSTATSWRAGRWSLVRSMS